jgi:hypothetical protein
MKLGKASCIAVCLGLYSSANAAQLISVLSSIDNTASLMAGDQSNSTLFDYATASQFHIWDNRVEINGITITFASTNNDTSRFLELGIFESTGSHGTDLAPGAWMGSFDTSTIPASDTKFSMDLTTISDFVLSGNRDYLLVWNAPPGAPYLGLKGSGTTNYMINDGVAGFFTGNKARSGDGGATWDSAMQTGFDHVSITGNIVLPLPAAFWLFGTGLLFLGGVAGRKDRIRLVRPL